MKSYSIFKWWFLFIFFFGFVKSQSASDFYISDNQGNENPTVSCNYPFVNGDCVGLTANYAAFKRTDKYTVSAKTFALYASSSKTVIKENLDDEFTSVVDLPFTFCFFDNAYTKIVIGSNGMISFDVAQANQPNAPNFSDTLPSDTLPKLSIFGALHDMYFSTSNDSEISYSVIGTAPFRKFIVNFTKGRISGCDELISNSQIALSEGSNMIEVFIDNKELPCDITKFKNSLIGINDGTGNLGIAAPNRNTGIWSAKQEAWVFSPAGNNVIPDFIWYDAANHIIGNTKDIVVCPKKDETYKLDIIFSVCNGDSVTYSDDINVKFAIDYPTAQDYTKLVCNINESIALKDFKQFLTSNDISNFNFEFTDVSTGQIVDENTAFTINSDRIFNVLISNKNYPDCKGTAVLTLKFFSDTILRNFVEVCDMQNDGIEKNYELNKLDKQLVDSSFLGTVSYFISQNDALNNKNPITFYDIKSGTKFFVRLSYQNCANVFGPITVRFNPTPVVNSPVDVKLDICDAKGDGVETVDWYVVLKDKITTDSGVSVIRVFNTYSEAYNATSSNLGIIELSPGNYTLFARVEYSGGCFSIAEIHMSVTFGVIKLATSTNFICYDGSQDISVNLDTYTANMLVSPTDGSVTGPRYFATPQDADDNSSALLISANQLITDNGDVVHKTFYARYDKGTECYSVQPIDIYLVHISKKNDSFNVCDINNDGTENIQLTDFASQIVVEPDADVLFYSSNQAAIDHLPGTNITSATITSSGILYARATFYTCSVIIPVTFTLVNTPKIKTEVQAVISNICDNNADGKENVNVTNYESQINVNNESVVFNYFKFYDVSTGVLSEEYLDPSQVEVSTGSEVFVKVEYKNGGCFSVAKITFELRFYPSINLSKTAKLEVCDNELNFGESFDLTKALPQVFNQNNNTIDLSDIIISYYVTENDANNGTSVGKITSPYTTSSGNEIVYVRFQSKVYGCYSVAPISLLSYFPVKARNSTIEICDKNLDGFYEVNLLDYKNQMVQSPNPDDIYTFYKNQADIGVPGAEIKTPENFVLNPYVSKIWVKIVNTIGCGTSAEVNFINGNKIVLNQNQFSINNVCDLGNDGKETINLSSFESNFGTGFTYEYFETKQNMIDNQNAIANPASYQFDEAKGISTFFVKVSQTGLCPNFYTINVKLTKLPEIKISDYFYCKNGTRGVDIAPNFSGLNIVYYQWKLPNGSTIEGADKNTLLNITTVGSYTLTLTNSSGCTYTTTFNVLYEEVPLITSLTGQNDYYLVGSTGISGKKILYSMDGIHWQESNYFGGLKAGDYTFYVRYADSDCNGDVKLGKIFTIKNAFTPNEDGINDYWRLAGLEVFSEKSTLQIFDKFGNLVYTQTSNTEFTWNGKFNSRNLSTDAYWYVITAGDGRTYNGWILLKNRN